MADLFGGRLNHEQKGFDMQAITCGGCSSINSDKGWLASKKHATELTVACVTDHTATAFLG